MRNIVLLICLSLFVFSCKKDKQNLLIGSWKVTSVVKVVNETDVDSDTTYVVNFQEGVNDYLFENTPVTLDIINVNNTTWTFSNEKLSKNENESYSYYINVSDKEYINVTTNPTKRVFEKTSIDKDNLVLTTTKQYISNMDGSRKTIYSVLRFKKDLK